MTNAEAIEWLKYNKEELERCQKDGGFKFVNEECNETIEALFAAISALEKQEGKKPIVETEKIEGIVEGLPAHRKYMLCPLCNENLRIESWTTKRCFGAGTVLKSNKNPDFCPQCGQRIDWSDEE